MTKQSTSKQSTAKQTMTKHEITTKQSTTLGVDVAKRQLDCSFGKGEESGTLPNSAEGRAKLLKLCAGRPGIRVICEASGGYEKALVKTLRQAGVDTRVVMPLRVRCYAIADGLMAKTDRIDARLPARFGEKIELAEHCTPSAFTEQLRELVDCRRHLNERLVELACKRENAGGRTLRLLEDERTHLLGLQTHIEKEIETLIAQNQEWHGKVKRMQQVKGVGPVLAATVCALVPEIGSVADKSISALVGVAAHPKQSGLNDRPRHVRGGRKHVRDVLYMAALCAITHNPILRRFYKRLKDKDKHSFVCIVAVMRKLICLLNQVCANPNFIIA
jgi:transposase